jgi:hypothetical protein
VDCIIYFLSQHSAFLWGFANNFVAGIVSAVCVLVLQQLHRLNRERKLFGSTVGDYEECTLPDGKATGGIIKIVRKGTCLLTTAVNSTGHVEWTGLINMNSQNPNVGDGTYHHPGKWDGGVHHIQRDPETSDFLVLGSNTTLPGGAKEWNTLWRRQRKSS